jgi:hypothetical protein
MRGMLYLFTHWNWKAALVVGLIRGGACAAALTGLTLHARQDFGLVEFAYVLATSGFASALQQQSLGVQSRRMGWFLCVVFIPFASLGLDAMCHLWINGIGGKQIGVIACIFTLVSAMFHWHVMSKGAMLVGEESRPLLDDMLAMPKLTFLFVAEPILVAWKLGKSLLRPVAPTVEDPVEELVV